MTSQPKLHIVKRDVGLCTPGARDWGEREYIKIPSPAKMHSLQYQQVVEKGHFLVSELLRKENPETWKPFSTVWWTMIPMPFLDHRATVHSMTWLSCSIVCCRI